jgi:hypothetical protein
VAWSHDAVIRVYDDAGKVIETHGHKSEFKRVVNLLALAGGGACGSFYELSNVDFRRGAYRYSLGRSLRFRCAKSLRHRLLQGEGGWPENRL